MVIGIDVNLTKVNVDNYESNNSVYSANNDNEDSVRIRTDPKRKTDDLDVNFQRTDDHLIKKIKLEQS